MNETVKPETPLATRIHARLEGQSTPPSVFRLVRRSHGLHFNSCALTLNELTGHLNSHELDSDFENNLYAIEALVSPAYGEWVYI